MTIFLMHIHRQHCTSCGRDESISRLYQAEQVNGRTGSAKKYLPCHSIGPLDPVNRMELGIVNIPLCSECVDDSRSVAGAEVYARWQETLQRKAAPASPPQAQSKAEPTLEDLA